MSLVAIVVALIGFSGSWIAYYVLYEFWPRAQSYDSWLPGPPDLLIEALLLLMGLTPAAVIAFRLARRILEPLSSLSESARRIAAGDLTARANAGDRSLGETAQLVDDFNAMAVRLENAAADMAYWNAAIAHELRTPLTILQGRLQGMRDGVFEPRNELLHALLVQVEGLSRLVDDLRLVTMQDTCRLDLRRTSINVAEEVQRALDSMRPALVNAGFQVALTRVDVEMHCDGARLRQALLALLENALRYATPGPLQLNMLIEAGRLLIQVQDEGPGLTLDFARRAFEPFSRGEASRLRAYGGSGLGLSVVRAIAIAHEGAARYRTADSGGSIFELELPLQAAGG